jgi:hypothetical protein
MDDAWWNQKCAPVAESPLDAYRGRGIHTKIAKPREKRLKSPKKVIQDCSGAIIPNKGDIITLFISPEKR